MPQQGVTPLPGQNPFPMSQGIENVVTQPPEGTYVSNSSDGWGPYGNWHTPPVPGGRGYAPPGYISGPLDQIMTVEDYNAMYGGNPNPKQQGMAFAGGGISHLGDYSDGGRLLRGPGDGVSDSIPATIANKQPARLADGEFVVPARIVSELGNGSTEAGARKLYQMLARVQNARKKSIGQGRVAVNSRADKMLPA